MPVDLGKTEEFFEARVAEMAAIYRKDPGALRQAPANLHDPDVAARVYVGFEMLSKGSPTRPWVELVVKPNAANPSYFDITSLIRPPASKWKVVHQQLHVADPDAGATIEVKSWAINQLRQETANLPTSAWPNAEAYVKTVLRLVHAPPATQAIESEFFDRVASSVAYYRQSPDLLRNAPAFVKKLDTAAKIETGFHMLGDPPHGWLVFTTSRNAKGGIDAEVDVRRPPRGPLEVVAVLENVRDPFDGRDLDLKYQGLMKLRRIVVDTPAEKWPSPEEEHYVRLVLELTLFGRQPPQVSPPEPEPVPEAVPAHHLPVAVPGVHARRTFVLRRSVYHPGFDILLFIERPDRPFHVERMTTAIEPHSAAVEAAKSYVDDLAGRVSPSPGIIRALDEYGRCFYAAISTHDGPKEVECPAPLPNPRGPRGPRGQRFCFYKTCVDFDASDVAYLNAMIDAGQEIFRKTMLKHVDLGPIARRLGYADHPSQGITMPQDYGVSYYRSTFRGWPAYYFVWSLIEHIFVPCEALQEIQNPVEACGLCFEFAAQEAIEWIIESKPPPVLEVVHAEHVWALEGGHAWVERGGFAYDWQMTTGVWIGDPLPELQLEDRPMPRGRPIENYYAVTRPQGIRRYSAQEAMANSMGIYGHFGPWIGPPQRRRKRF